MSWSVNAVGKTEAVRESLEAQFSNITYLQGAEDSVKDATLELVTAALDGYTADMVVNVSANGHGSTSGDKTAQTVSVSITPTYGFAE